MSQPFAPAHLFSSPYPSRREPSFWTPPSTASFSAGAPPGAVDQRALFFGASHDGSLGPYYARSSTASYPSSVYGSPHALIPSSHAPSSHLATAYRPSSSFDPHPHPTYSSPAVYPFVGEDFALDFDLLTDDRFNPSVDFGASQTIFRGPSTTTCADQPPLIKPLSPANSDGGQQGVQMVGGKSLLFRHDLASHAYPSSSMRQGAEALEDGDPVNDSHADEVDRYLDLECLISPYEGAGGSDSTGGLLSTFDTHHSLSPPAYTCMHSVFESVSPASSTGQSSADDKALNSIAPPPTSLGELAHIPQPSDLDDNAPPAARRTRVVDNVRSSWSVKHERDEKAQQGLQLCEGGPVKRIKIKVDKQLSLRADVSARPVKVGKRKGKAPSSCAECRRLKMKCNLREQQPCSSCVTRGCPTVCPHGQLANMKGKRLVLADTEALHARITALETALAVSFAREDQSLKDAVVVKDANGRRIHPLLRAEYVDGVYGAAHDASADDDEGESSSSED